jgi:ABC-type nitrate/sulfonate/bicarbonate transport system ATPase subunit
MTNSKVKIRVEELSHSFRSPGDPSAHDLKVLKSVSFHVFKHEIVCLLGPSGCGKTTLLRALAGLLLPLEGRVYVDDEPIRGPSPERILVFQELHLFHWMTVLKNVEFATEARGIPSSNRRPLARELLSLVGLSEFEDYYPHEISGGMRQRLALARALAAEPSVLLMDEPFGALDVETRVRLQEEFLLLHQKKKFTTVIVTHDPRQAIFLADRVLVLSHRPGTVEKFCQIPFARPRDAKLQHTSEFVAIETSLFNNSASGRLDS